MKTFQVHFKIKKPVLVQAAGKRINGSRLEFHDDNEVVTQWFEASTVTGVTIFSDDDDPGVYS